jgi:hypothetical protein
VPAHPSASIPSALTQLAHADPLQPDDAPHLLAFLATVRDPRARTGRHHPLVAILAMAAAAVLTGARSMTRSPSGPRTLPSQPVPRSAPVVMPPTAGRCRPRPRCAGPSHASTRPRWPLWSVHGSPTVTVPGRIDGRSRSTARRCGAPTATVGRSMLDCTRDRAHGRVELRTLKAVSVRQFGFPHAVQVIQVTRSWPGCAILSSARSAGLGSVDLAAAPRYHAHDPRRPSPPSASLSHETDITQACRIQPWGSHALCG